MAQWKGWEFTVISSENGWVKCWGPRGTSAFDGHLMDGVHESWWIWEASSGGQAKPIRFREAGLDGSGFRIQQEIPGSCLSVCSAAPENEFAVMANPL